MRTIDRKCRSESMNTGPKEKILNDYDSRPVTAEQRLTQLGVKLPAPPEPFGIYAEAVQTGNMLFLTGMRSEEHTSELQSQSNLVCRLLLEKKKKYVLRIQTVSRL